MANDADATHASDRAWSNPHSLSLEEIQGVLGSYPLNRQTPLQQHETIIRCIAWTETADEMMNMVEAACTRTQVGHSSNDISILLEDLKDKLLQIRDITLLNATAAANARR
eukprot:s19_g26.t1